MLILAKIFTALVALEHIYILVLEMFLWKTPYGRKTFGMTAKQAEETATLAMNQGLYNGFLAAGLIWALILIHTNPKMGFQVALFFLACVVVAGIFGGLTAKFSILFIQGVPALIGLLLVFLASRAIQS